MRFLILILFTMLLTGPALGQSIPIKIVFETNQKDTPTRLNETKIYILKKQTENSDFNYSKLDNIDLNRIDTLNPSNLLPVFEPLNGQFNYYQFLATFKGESYDGSIKDFHDILIIKTNTEGKIIDAYQYTLESAEPPLQYDVFKSSIQNISLINNMDINQLKFMRTYSLSDENKELKENGVIKLK